jgi:TonB family protein
MKLLRLISVALFAMTGLGSFATAAEPQWIEGRSPHFLLLTDTSEAKGRRLLEDLEGRVKALADVVGAIPERQFPIEVFLFEKGPDFIEVTGAEPMKSAYLFRGLDRIFIVSRDKSPDDIANEVGHALGHVFFERTTLWRPFWLAEGAAEHFRKAGRKPDTKSVPKEESFSARDLLRIVPSPGYRDSDPAPPSRIQSHRLLRLIAERHPGALKGFLEVNRREVGEKARIDIDPATLGDELEAYTEAVIPLTPQAAGIRMAPADSASVALRRGDLLVAAGKTSAASERYTGVSAEARAARAILIRSTRNPLEAARALERAAREQPDHGLVHFHFGSLEITAPADLIAAQAQSLERAVQTYPLLGRAAAELARVYTLNGRAEMAQPLIDKAIALEPEFADRFYDIRAQALAALKRFDEAYQTMKLSSALPHTGEKIEAIYEQKVKAMTERAENFRRDADAERLNQIRNDVDRVAALLDPPPPPPPPPPAPKQSGMEYTIQAEEKITVINSVYPVFPPALLQSGRGGEIDFSLTIDPDGRVTRVEVVNSQLPDLNALTTASLRRWTFKPVVVNGQAIPFRMLLTFRYDVREADAVPAVQ